jgi:hypothetical protein
MKFNRRSFLRTALCAAALCVTPSFILPTTRRLRAIQDMPFSPRHVQPGETLTVNYTRRLDDLVLFENERVFDCRDFATYYGCTVAEYDDGSYEVVKLVDCWILRDFA